MEEITGTELEYVVEGVIAAALELMLDDGVTVGTDLVIEVYEGMIHVAVLLAGTELGVDDATTVEVLAQLKLTLWNVTEQGGAVDVAGWQDKALALPHWELSIVLI